MKTFQFIFLATISVVGLFSSCQPDEQPAPADARDVFVAAWTCNEHSTQIGNSTFTVDINKSTTSTSQLLLENIYNLGFAQKAVTDLSGTSLTIAQQTLNGNQIHGSGTKTGANTISLTYYVNNGSAIDTCTATLTRQ
jgi:hypothetical protein